MFYVAAQENKKGQILRIKSQVSRLLTIKYNSADLSLKFSFRRGWQRGGSNHTSRSIFYRFFFLNHASRTCKIENHASSCDVRSRVTRIIWVQSRVTLQVLGPSRVTQKPFATLLEVPHITK